MANLIQLCHNIARFVFLPFQSVHLLLYILVLYILSDYKRVLKENEELKNQEATARKINELLVERYSNSIQVQKVKDKIEKLNQYYKKEIYPSLYQWGDITITEHYDEMIELLQEIIGDK